LPSVTVVVIAEQLNPQAAAVLEDGCVLDVLANRPLGHAEDLGDLALAEPNGPVLEAHVERRATVLALGEMEGPIASNTQKGHFVMRARPEATPRRASRSDHLDLDDILSKRLSRSDKPVSRALPSMSGTHFRMDVSLEFRARREYSIDFWTFVVDPCRVKRNEARIAAQAFGAAVRSTRLRLDITQETLAEQSQLDRTYLSGVERGLRNPTFVSIFRIASALHVRPSNLFLEAERILYPDDGEDDKIP
jgi:DNA-binding XRE family transcriptional regulator